MSSGKDHAQASEPMEKCSICKEIKEVHQTITHVGGGEVVSVDYFCERCWDASQAKWKAYTDEMDAHLSAHCPAHKTYLRPTGSENVPFAYVGIDVIPLALDVLGDVQPLEGKEGGAE